MTLNERISAWFEPKPTEPSLVQGMESPKRAWICLDGEWQARLWFTDEAANARLLEAMATHEDGIKLEMWLGSDEILNVWIQDRSLSTPKLYVKASDRKTAIVLAFCKWANIEIDSREGE